VQTLYPIFIFHKELIDFVVGDGISKGKINTLIGVGEAYHTKNIVAYYFFLGDKNK